MTGFDGEGYPERNDISNAYRLALGRDPEAGSVIDERLRQKNADWFPGFFTSPEFIRQVRDRIVRGDELRGGYFDMRPPLDLIAWTASFAPLEPDSREKLQGSIDWHGIYHILFSDPTFITTIFPGWNGEADGELLAALEAKCRSAPAKRIKAEIEATSSAEIRGWAVDIDSPNQSLPLEVWIEGAFIAAGTTRIFRRDIQDRFGGGGGAGFLIRYTLPEHLSGKLLFGDLREAISGQTLATFGLPIFTSPIDEALTIKHEIRELRTLLDRIEAKLPSFNTVFGYPLDAYGHYFRDYYAPLQRAEHRKPAMPVAVVVIGPGASLPVLEDALTSLYSQVESSSEIWLLHDLQDADLELAASLDRWKRLFTSAVSITAIHVDQGNFASALNDVAGLTTCEIMLFMPSPYLAAVDAVAALSRAITAGAVLAYADEDSIAGAGPLSPQHVLPKFKADFDYDLLLQSDYLSGLIALPRSMITKHRFRAETGPLFMFDLALRISEIEDHGRITHVPLVLSHYDAAGYVATVPKQEERLSVLRAHIARTDAEASVEAHADAMGSALPQHARVRWPISEESSVAIIIPTRDRLDLLGPCLASIAASIPHNRVRIEVLLVDNQSEELTTTAVLQQFQNSGMIRLLQHDGRFNWAAINNRAVEQTDADVLIFLNNDTMMITPDAWDELCAIALRPDVGAVGARLLYEDGTIQHAGVVIDDWLMFATHEGVGAAASEPGYLGRHMLMRQTSSVTGACLATSAAVFREAGGFDAINFPVEGNDTDYCLRLRERGFKVIYDPYATFYHFESKSRGYNIDDEKRQRADEATRLLRERWAGRFGKDPFYNAHFDRLTPPFTRLRPPPSLEL